MRGFILRTRLHCVTTSKWLIIAVIFESLAVMMTRTFSRLIDTKENRRRHLILPRVRLNIGILSSPGPLIRSALHGCNYPAATQSESYQPAYYRRSVITLSGQIDRHQQESNTPTDLMKFTSSDAFLPSTNFRSTWRRRP